MVAQLLTAAPVAAAGAVVIDIAAGGSQTCAVVTGGVVMCWGGNGYGQLGTGDMITRLRPTAMGLGQGSSIPYPTVF